MVADFGWPADHQRCITVQPQPKGPWPNLHSALDPIPPPPRDFLQYAARGSGNSCAVCQSSQAHTTSSSGCRRCLQLACTTCQRFPFVPSDFHLPRANDWFWFFPAFVSCCKPCGAYSSATCVSLRALHVYHCRCRGTALHHLIIIKRQQNFQCSKQQL